MKVLIFTAGHGSRLKKLIPKSLCKISDSETLLDYQLKYLKNRIALENIIIVVGYKKESIIEKYPFISFVCNNNYDKTETAKSILLGLQKIDDDVLCIAGDVYFNENVLDLMLKSIHSSCLVNKKKNCRKEKVKYIANENGTKLKSLSKSINNADGEVLGLFLIKKPDLKAVIKELDSLRDNDYFSKGLSNLIKKNELKLVPIYITKYFCQEIDFKRDLEKVIKFIEKI